MARSARVAGVALVAGVWLMTSSAAWAGPIVSTGPYTVTMPSGASYEVSGEVNHNGVGAYVYSYTVKLVNDVAARTFELGLAEHWYLWGKYTETNPQVSPGPGELERDLIPHTNYYWGPAFGIHNYVFTHRENGQRVGIDIAPGETHVFSFEDAHAPTLLKWSLREIDPVIMTRNNFALQAGKLPVPGAPEPSSLALAGMGLAGMGMGAWRRRRKAAAATEETPAETV
jgi:hypothetical protein